MFKGWLNVSEISKLKLSCVALAVGSSMSLTPVQAASITVDIAAGCTLIKAINSANNDLADAPCTGGSGADVIVLPATIPTYTNQIAGPSHANIQSYAALPAITSEVTIQGVSPVRTSIERSGGAFRLFTVEPSGSLTLEAVAIKNGLSDNGGGIATYGDLTLDNSVVSGNAASGSGGGIWAYDAQIEIRNGSTITMNNGGTGGGMSLSYTGLTVTDSTISANNASASFGGIDAYEPGATFVLHNANIENNTAATNGGGVSIRGYYTGGEPTSVVSIVDSTISNNTASDGFGGGVYTNYTAATLTNTVVSANQSDTGGAGLYVKGLNSTLLIAGSTIADNLATATMGKGGAICLADTDATINKSTLSGNRAGDSGGAIYALDADLKIQVSTLSGNTAAYAAAVGIENGSLQVVGSTVYQNQTTAAGIAATLQANIVPVVNNTVIAGSSALDCALTGALVDDNSSWFGDASCNGVAAGVPQLSSLADNNRGFAGTTLTHLPLPSSPLRGAGNAAYCNGSIDPLFATDQRGAARADCNIGAVDGSVAETCFVIPTPNGRAVIFCL